MKKASAEHIADINTSGSLSLVEYSPPRRLYIEWRPNDNILIADDSQDQGDWALVDTISRRSRTTSESKVFNTKPEMSSSKPRVLRTHLEELGTIEVKHRGSTIRFIRKCDATLHTEYFFQHGNADLFVRSMQQLHIIDNSPTNREEFVVLTTETQKLKKTFATLDIGEIKASSLGTESWLPNKVVGFLMNFPDYVQPHKNMPKTRPGTVAMDRRERNHKSAFTPTGDNYQIVGISDSASTCTNSRGSSLDKSPSDNGELANIKEEEEKIVHLLPERQPVMRGKRFLFAAQSSA